MDISEATDLLDDAVPLNSGGTWADLGAGDGTFTLALARLLGPNGRIFAVDRDQVSLRDLERRAIGWECLNRITTITADFTGHFDLGGLVAHHLDGMLFANSLHFVRDSQAVLTRLMRWLRPGARVVFVEYDRRPASRWVPYPLDAAKLVTLCKSVGLSEPMTTATRPSDYGGNLYVAMAVVPTG